MIYIACDNARVTVGDKIKVTGKCNGIIRYIGYPLFKSGLWYGIELNEPIGNNNGTIDKIQYFKCQDNYGFFTQIVNLQKQGFIKI